MMSFNWMNRIFIWIVRSSAFRGRNEEIYKDHKMEIEAKKALDRQIAGFAEKESRLIDLFTGGSITQDLYTKKLTEYRQDKKKLEERLS